MFVDGSVRCPRFATSGCPLSVGNNVSERADGRRDERNFLPIG
jgi:hypothetical protein